MALMILLDNITQALDKGDYAIGVFLDFQKAFDTVNHDILLEKLYIYGIRDNAYNWIANYLTNRKQFITYDNYKSECQNITCGVPQGSILGPLLFLVYINDLAYISPLFLSILFADDSNLFCSGPNIDQMIININIELVKITDWLNANKLSLHVGKTKFIIFAPKGKPVVFNNNIIINYTEISRVNHIKFLGVVIDDKLSWSTHIQYIKAKVAKGFGALLKARKVFDQETLITLYYSMIYPYISYCIHVWGTAYYTHLKDIVILQKRIIRVIAGVPPLSNTSPLFKSLKILNIKGIFLYTLGLFMFKLKCKMLPDNLFATMFRHTTNIHNYPTRQCNSFYIETCSTTRSQKNIKFIGPFIWNILITKLNVSCKISTFKNNLCLLIASIY